MDLSALALPTDDPVLLLAVDPGLERGHRLPVNGADGSWRVFGVPARRLTVAETLQCLKKHPALWDAGCGDRLGLGPRLRQLQWALSVRAANSKECAKAAHYAELVPLHQVLVELGHMRRLRHRVLRREASRPDRRTVSDRGQGGAHELWVTPAHLVRFLKAAKGGKEQVRQRMLDECEGRGCAAPSEASEPPSMGVGDYQI